MTESSNEQDTRLQFSASQLPIGPGLPHLLMGEGEDYEQISPTDMRVRRDDPSTRFPMRTYR